MAADDSGMRLNLNLDEDPEPKKMSVGEQKQLKGNPQFIGFIRGKFNEVISTEHSLSELRVIGTNVRRVNSMHT